MARTLKIAFGLDDEKEMTVTLPEPKADITKAEVDAVCNDAVNKEILLVNGAAAVEYKGAVIREVTETPLV